MLKIQSLQDSMRKLGSGISYWKIEAFCLKGLAGFLFLILTIGCSKDFLEQPPKDTLDESSFWQTPEHASFALNALYDVLQLEGAYNLGWVVLGDMPGEDITTFDGGAFGTQYARVDQFVSSPNDYHVCIANWLAWYTGIERCCEFIDKIPSIEMNPALKQRYINEAYFIRGLCYFQLAINYGNVPVFTSPLPPEESVRINPAGIEKVWQQAESDLLEACNLPEKNNPIWGEEAGHATRDAAHALLSRVYLYQSKYQEAKDQAEIVMNSGLYSLWGLSTEDSIAGLGYGDNFKLENEDGKESIFEVHFYNDLELGWMTKEGTFIRYFTAAAGWNNPGWAIFLPVARLDTIYEPGDKRRKVNIFKAGDVYKPSNFPAGIDSVWRRGNSQTSLGIAKYIAGYDYEERLSAAMSPGNSCNAPVLRYAEVILNYAEAAVNLGLFTEGVQYINMIRKRAGVLPVEVAYPSAISNKEQLIDIILQERRKEFFCEGHRVYDLARTGHLRSTFEKLGIAVPAGRDQFPLYPIPQIELDRNPNLEQNPSYQ